MRAVAEKYGLQFEDINDGISEERPNYDKQAKAWYESYNKYSQNEETNEYSEWRKENDALRAKAEEILDEFYQERNAPDDTRLTVTEYAEGRFRIHNGGEDYLLDREKLSQEQRDRISENLTRYLQEMSDFTEFLKRRFLNK